MLHGLAGICGADHSRIGRLKTSAGSWGGVRKFDHHPLFLRPHDRNDQILPSLGHTGKTMLAHGMGKSYGDVAQNHQNHLLLTQKLDFLIAADWGTGRIVAGAGLTVAELHKICLPRRWMLPVVPGTAAATLGGCVANDVHGKNHPAAGSFGSHVIGLKLWRSSGEAMMCSAETNSDMFALTIGGLGLTGLIEWVELQLTPCRSQIMDEETRTATDLSDLFAMFQDGAGWTHKTAWIDGTVSGMDGFQSLFSRARFDTSASSENMGQGRVFSVPCTIPEWMLNNTSIRAFNRLYLQRATSRPRARRHHKTVLFPLDGLTHWNRLYGKRGFFQYHALIPKTSAQAGVEQILRRVLHGPLRSFLTVLKWHGNNTAPGVLSFCDEGAGIAMDFPNQGDATLALLNNLDSIVLEHGGRVYPAKDMRMSARTFQQFYPSWVDLEAGRDPAFSSSFWRRVTDDIGA